MADPAKILKTAQAKLARLQSDLMKLEQERMTAIEKRRGLLLAEHEADAKVLRAIDDAVARAERMIGGCEDALQLAQQEVRDAEGALAAERDQQRRQAEADRVAAAISAMNEAHTAFRAAAMPLAQALQAAGTQEAVQAVVGVRGLSEYLASMVPQITADLKAYAHGVERGGEFMHRAEAPPPAKAREPKPELRQVYFIEFTKWTGDDGQLRTAKQFSTTELAPVLAQKAIKVGLALDPRDPNADRLRTDFGNSWDAVDADPARCIDLNLIDPATDVRRVGALVVLEQQRNAQVRAA